MWKRKVSRHFGLVIHPHITLEEANECVRDHDLMVRLFYANEPVTKLDETGTQNTARYMVGPKGTAIQVTFEQQGLRAVSHERLDLGVSCLIYWQAVPRPQDARKSIVLTEEMELQIPRLLSLVFPWPVRAGSAVSVKTQLLAAAMEIRHRRSDISLDELVREAREMVVGVDMKTQPI